MNVRSISKILDSQDERTTKVTLLPRYHDHFNRYLTKRKLVLDPPYKTDVWNNIESAYTGFEFPVLYDAADLIFDDWLDELVEATKDK